MKSLMVALLFSSSFAFAESQSFQYERKVGNDTTATFYNPGIWSNEGQTHFFTAMTSHEQANHICKYLGMNQAVYITHEEAEPLKNDLFTIHITNDGVWSIASFSEDTYVVTAISCTLNN